MEFFLDHAEVHLLVEYILSHGKDERGEGPGGCARVHSCMEAGFDQDLILLEQVNYPVSLLGREHTRRRHQARVLISLYDQCREAPEEVVIEGGTRGRSVQWQPCASAR